MGRVLIVVDMQRDFIDMALGTPEAQNIVKDVADFIKSFDIEKDTIVCTKDTHFDSTYFKCQEGQKLPIPHCIFGTEGWTFANEITEALSYYNPAIIYKQTFGYKNWPELHYDDAEEIILCGLCTDICVMANAVILKTLYPEIPVVVMKDLCAGTTEKKHQEALDIMKSLQIEVR